MANSKPIEIIVCGAAGRMGTAILQLAFENPQFIVAGAVESKVSSAVGGDAGEIAGVSRRNIKIGSDLSAVLQKGRVIITFTSPDATSDHLKTATSLGAPIVIGTTGLTEQHLLAIKTASKRIPVLHSSNMSVGVNIFWKLVRRAAELAKGYDVEIAEFHHNQKKDSPSGTAKTTLEIVADVRHLEPKRDFKYGRVGESAKRSPGEIGIHALRGGGVIGDHTIYFAGPNDRLEITHRAQGRESFAHGALLGAAFLANKKAGLYTMDDVLGL